MKNIERSIIDVNTNKKNATAANDPEKLIVKKSIPNLKTLNDKTLTSSKKTIITKENSIKKTGIAEKKKS